MPAKETPKAEKLEALMKQVYWLHNTGKVLHGKSKKAPTPATLRFSNHQVVPFTRSFSKALVSKEETKDFKKLVAKFTRKLDEIERDFAGFERGSHVTAAVEALRSLF